MLFPGQADNVARYLSSIQDLCAREWDVNEALERERVLSEEYMEKAAELVSKLERVRKYESATGGDLPCMMVCCRV